MRYKLPRTSKLTSRRSFSSVFDNPVRVSAPYFVLLAQKNDFGFPRLGMAVAKRAIKLAARRASVKRVVRESFRLNQHLLTGIDVVVIVRSRAGQLGGSDLRYFLDGQWPRIGELCRDSLLV